MAYEEDINLNPEFVYAEKLKIENLREPFVSAYIQSPIEKAQIETLFTEVPWLSKYYGNRIIKDLQVFDVSDYHSDKQFFTVYLFKEYCLMFKHDTLHDFGYVEHNNDPLGFTVGWIFTGSGSLEHDILMTYKSKINFMEALDFFSINGSILERYLLCDIDEIGTYRYLARMNKLEENHRDPKFIPVFNELYGYIEQKLLERIMCAFNNEWTHFDMRGYSIEVLPDIIGDCKSLQSLDLSYNYQLSKLPNSIKNLTHLKSIDLSGNKFEEFPIQLLRLPHLETVELDMNNIKILPKDIAKMEKLIKLDVYRNPIKNIPEKFLNEGTLKEKTLKIKKYLLEKI